MRKEVPSCGKAPSCCKGIPLWCPSWWCSQMLMLHVVGDGQVTGWLLCLCYAHAEIPKYSGCNIFEGAMGLKNKIQHGSPGWWLQCLVSCVLLLPLEWTAASPGELINFLPGAWLCSFFSISAGSSVSSWCTSTHQGRSPPLIMASKSPGQTAQEGKWHISYSRNLLGSAVQCLETSLISQKAWLQTLLTPVKRLPLDSVTLSHAQVTSGCYFQWEMDSGRREMMQILYL